MLDFRVTFPWIGLESSPDTEQEKNVTFIRPCEIESCSYVDEIAEYSN